MSGALGKGEDRGISKGWVLGVPAVNGDGKEARGLESKERDAGERR